MQPSIVRMASCIGSFHVGDRPGTLFVMDVVSYCPLRVASVRWQPRSGLHVLTVVAKATYQLTQGTSPLATQQDEVNEYENYWNDDPTRSLYAPSDLVPFKPRPDVLLVGYAYAPQEAPARTVTARLVVAGIDKGIEVHADRSLGHDGVVRESSPFTRLPLRYERAAAGWTNPVGMRPDAAPDRTGGVSLPNLVPPGRTSFLSGESIESIGFGPIASTWPVRARKLPQHMTELAADWYQRPLPEGLDPSYFNVAPSDQQVAQLRPDEQIYLEYLHPKHSSFTTQLAGVMPKVVVERATGQEELTMTPDTLWIDTDRYLCTLTWRGQIRLEHADAQGRVVVSMSQLSQDRDGPRVDGTLWVPSAPGSNAGASPLSAQDFPREEVSVQPAENASLDMTTYGVQDRNPTMPFLMGKSGSSDLSDAWSPPRHASDLERDEVGGTHFVMADALRAPPLPFAGLQDPVASAAPQQAPLMFAPTVSPDFLPSPYVVTAQPAPAMTVGQAAMLGLSAAAAPNAMAPDPMSGMLSAHASSDPSSDAARAIPQFGSVAVLQQAGFVAGMPPLSATAASHAAADPSSYGIGISRGTTPAFRGRVPVELLWHDPAFVENVRKDRALRAILDERNKASPRKNTEAKQPAQPRPNTPDPKDREDIAAILTLGSPQGIDGLGFVMADAVDDRGTFRPPLMLLAGDLEFPFDEVETLKATVAAVTPLSTGDKKLKELVDAVGELMRTPWLQAAGAVTDRLTGQIKETFAAGNRLLPSGFLETHTERILLENRHYQKRALLGQTWIRALLGASGSSTRVPTYIPHALSRDLPMYQRFPVRMIAEVRAQIDQYETHSCALRVVAIGRMLGGAVRK